MVFRSAQRIGESEKFWRKIWHSQLYQYVIFQKIEKKLERRQVTHIIFWQ